MDIDAKGVFTRQSSSMVNVPIQEVMTVDVCSSGCDSGTMCCEEGVAYAPKNSHIPNIPPSCFCRHRKSTNNNKIYRQPPFYFYGRTLSFSPRSIIARKKATVVMKREGLLITSTTISSRLFLFFFL